MQYYGLLEARAIRKLPVQLLKYDPHLIDKVKFLSKYFLRKAQEDQFQRQVLQPCTNFKVKWMQILSIEYKPQLIKLDKKNLKQIRLDIE